MDAARAVAAKNTVDIVRAHDEGRLNLWGTGISHDVVIKCRGVTWKCHYEILTRESDWFAGVEKWEDDREGRVVTLSMENHDPMRLGYCLRFMYEKTFAFGTFQHNDPLSINNIRTNIFMYNCGSSIKYQNLMDYTCKNLYQYAKDLKAFLDTLPPAANHIPVGFVGELRLAIAETTGHTVNPEAFFQLRNAMASVMEVLLPWCRQHPAFIAATKNNSQWTQLLKQADMDIKQANELGYVYGNTVFGTYVFAPPPE